MSNLINNEIKSKVVNVVNEGSKGMTQMSLEEAIELAESQGKDVICLNSKESIPVVKIADYGKFMYEKAKKDKDNRKKARLNSQDIKEIQISDSIAQHDLEIKAKNIDRIISDGDKVRLVIKYKGRSIRLINEGPGKLQALVGLLNSKYKIDKTPQIEGNKVTMLVAPDAKKGA